VAERPPNLSPDQLLKAYAIGIFPMAEHRDDPEIFWVDPERRGILPLDGFHISRSLARALRQSAFRISTDQAFEAVVSGCADRAETWINATILDLYLQLHARGIGHSLEVWDGADLVGGVYGVAIGGAFFGESMFSRRSNASKIALAYLVDRLRIGGFTLFDTQYLTPHLRSLGGREISRAAYHERLYAAVRQVADFDRQRGIPSPQDVIQRSIQTS
jgi:leucyl/phenylalanyl-tRNA--protein transferase